jgi:hypothetical protein
MADAQTYEERATLANLISCPELTDVFICVLYNDIFRILECTALHLGRLVSNKLKRTRKEAVVV